MDITNFKDLLAAARQQAEPQRLLFVFVSTGLPEDANPAQKISHARGEGGELTPVLCVDKAPGEVASFAALAAESENTGQDWQLVFVAAMEDTSGDAAHDETVDNAFQRMTQMIKYGTIASLMAFDRHGDPVVFGAV